MTDSARGFGIDIGGSGIKGAVVDLEEGRFAGERLRIPTPQPSTPKAVAEVCAQIVQEQGWEGPVGLHVPRGGGARHRAYRSQRGRVVDRHATWR